MPGTTSTALLSFSHDQHHKTDAAKWKGGFNGFNCFLGYHVESHRVVGADKDNVAITVYRVIAASSSVRRHSSPATHLYSRRRAALDQLSAASDSSSDEQLGWARLVTQHQPTHGQTDARTCSAAARRRTDEEMAHRVRNRGLTHDFGLLRCVETIDEPRRQPFTARLFV